MNKLCLIVVSILATSLFVSMQSRVAASSPRHYKGFEIYFYETPDAAFTALKASEVDMIQWSLTSEQYQYAVSDSTLVLAGSVGFGIKEFDLNNNYTIYAYPSVRSPTNEITFRQALAHMVDKNWIISDVMNGFGERVDVPIGAAIMGYANESVIGGNYPYPYNLTRAAELLDIHFADTDLDGTRNYPVGWPGRESGPNLDSLVTLIRIDDEHRYAAGQALVNNMQALGIPVKKIVDPFIIYFHLEQMNYHIYTGGWSFGRRPTYLYALFHSDNWLPGWSNYVTGMNSSNLPNYPDLDDILEDVYYAEDNNAFKDAVKKATGLLVEYCVNIPLFSHKYFWAYSKNLAGVVNEDGYGLENTYTFLNAYKADDPATPQDESQDPIRMGTIQVPKSLNILYSSWFYDYAVLDRVFDSLLSMSPYDLSVDQPWIAQDWEVTTWLDPEEPEPSRQKKTKATYWIRKDVWWHAPVTGEAVRQFTAHDVEFTIWYNYIFDDSWQWYSFSAIHHTSIIDDFAIEVYFDSLSVMLQYRPTYPLLPKHEYLELLCKHVCVSLEITDPVSAGDTMMLPTTDQVIQMVNATKYPEEIPLYEGIDYEIFAVNYSHTKIHWLGSLDPNETVVFCYWTNNLDPHGYYLADLEWNQTFYSIGPYYPVDIVPGAGGYAIFNCTQSFFLETPPLGEIDWMWTFTGTTRPCSGYYQVNLFDAVALLKAYGTSGNGEPDPNWFPGADLDPNEIGRIGLFDAVTLLINYGDKFGTPPDP